MSSNDDREKQNNEKREQLLSRLTRRELEVLALKLRDGWKRNKELSGRLGISVKTFSQHIANIARKCDCRRADELDRIFVRRVVPETIDAVYGSLAA